MYGNIFRDFAIFCVAAGVLVGSLIVALAVGIAKWVL